jgi:2-polyprenyl-6-methoxyphenol hydroxylase-like FAD-dependent oxidoreductase
MKVRDSASTGKTRLLISGASIAGLCTAWGLLRYGFEVTVVERATDSHSASRVCMDSWSLGRVVLVGDAGYSVTPATGQETAVAMVGAYVLAGALAAHPSAFVAGISSYEHELRDYVSRNLDLALDTTAGRDTQPDGIPDFVQVHSCRPTTA